MPAHAVARLRSDVFAVKDAAGFDALALELFRIHVERNPVYRDFIAALGLDPQAILRAADIPCLPITVFRSQRVLLDGLEPALAFTSSGTTGSITSTHLLPWPEHYERSFMTSFSAAYGNPSEWRILALLPAYLERQGSSLVYMAERLIAASGDSRSGFYLNQYDELAEVLKRSEVEGRKTLLLGVTFALLDLAERHPMRLQHTTIMETGGMKGRRPEIVREELHSILKRAFGVASIHSEYGMTELLSQAWSTGDGRYRCPPWMRVSLREVNDPFSPVDFGRTGGIDVIDLANVGSCPFIGTQDLGRMQPDGSFEVLGRFDNSDARGCNLMVE
ncbi:MAG: acyl transferase [Flavobacteriales bacterium]|jgi:phenylacetate-coenzyme A ligase PaaK-like adenylate-forming protein|nr:acyl transferase [Flavobacteriales bacterium]